MAYYDKTLTEVVQSIINNIHDTLPEADTKPGTFIRDVFIDPVSDEITAMYGDMRLVRLAQSVLTSVGDDLDYLAANYFVTRKAATKSTGKIRFYLKNTNKSVTQIKEKDIPETISIPAGTILRTTASYSSEPIEVATTESLVYTREQILQLSIDGDTGYRFVEAAAESIDAGADKNVAAEAISAIYGSSFPFVAFVSNPYAFSGGTDVETDASLSRRIRLAVTGSNIGTKDGYLAYALQQAAVIDAKVVGAGDNIMFRDGGYINAEGNYIPGIGGCVDVYIRGHQFSEKSYQFTLTSEYIHTGDIPEKIIIPYQPVTNIISITSNLTGETLINGSDFETEKTTVQDPDDASNVIVTTQYCQDILWDFSVIDSFPDLDYYSLPDGITEEQTKRLKQKVDSELTDAKTYMLNMTYAINWGTTYESSEEGGTTELFRKIYYNNGVYKLIAKDDSGLDGRMFIMKNDQIYERVYMNPDYILTKDTSNYAGSVVASDSIQWIRTDKLILNDTLTILYNYDYLIENIQYNMEQVRCLTANVLVKQAIEVPVEIIADVECYNYNTLSSIKSALASAISTALNNLELGATFDRSDIAALLKQNANVDTVDLDTLSISVVEQSPQKKLTCADNAYFTVANIIINITYNSTISA